MNARAAELRGKGKLAFVPTMGFLHEGHLSLMREGLHRADSLVVSIFVNPAQFGPGEDFEAYPRNLERDCELAEKVGANIVFTPNEKSLYPAGFQTYVRLEELPNHLCGISRPLHFRGVATVVAKLFNIVTPHIAVFGQKDYQQLLIIRRMVRDLNFNIEIIGHPIVREPDGLAMSSRNSYLTSDQRKRALALYNALKKTQFLIESGITDAAVIIDEISKFIRSHPETRIDYVALCDPETLDDIKTIDGPVLTALAVKVGNTRLIDNMILNVPDTRT
jgi:pantoate--beta-alanine ligase